MTDKPPKSQIEAAANAIRIRLFEVGIDPVEGLATAALTAAADVPDQEHIRQKPGQKPDLLPSGNAAAEVGKKEVTSVDVALAVEAATIERCAQVAENWSSTWPTSEAARAIAAAIRALKDS